MKLMRQVLITGVLFIALDLIFTVLALLTAPASANIGTARAMSTVPFHELELGVAGLVLGVVAVWIYGRGGAAPALLLPSLVILLDLDHTPALLGLAQPIRPAHSLLFLALDVTITTIILRRVDFGLLVVSAFSGHIGVDTGVIPPYSPVSFQYVGIAPYHALMLAISVLAAFSAGYFMRRKGGPI